MVDGSAGLALKVIGHSLTFGMAAQGTWEATERAVEAYENGTFSGWNVLDVGMNALGMGLSGRAAFSNGMELANRIAASETGQKVAKGIKQLAADNRGSVPWVGKTEGENKVRTLYHYTNEYFPAGLAQKLIKVPNKYKYTHYVEIDITDLGIVKGRDGIYVIPNNSPLDLMGRIVSTGKVGGK